METAGRMFIHKDMIRIRGDVPEDYLVELNQLLFKNIENEVFDGVDNGAFTLSKAPENQNVATWTFSDERSTKETAEILKDILYHHRRYNLSVVPYSEAHPVWYVRDESN